jgi:hypothetical protein
MRDSGLLAMNAAFRQRRLFGKDASRHCAGGTHPASRHVRVRRRDGWGAPSDRIFVNPNHLAGVGALPLHPGAIPHAIGEAKLDGIPSPPPGAERVRERWGVRIRVAEFDENVKARHYLPKIFLAHLALDKDLPPPLPGPLRPRGRRGGLRRIRRSFITCPTPNRGVGAAPLRWRGGTICRGVGSLRAPSRGDRDELRSRGTARSWPAPRPPASMPTESSSALHALRPYCSAAAP